MLHVRPVVMLQLQHYARRNPTLQIRAQRVAVAVEQGLALVFHGF